MLFGVTVPRAGRIVCSLLRSHTSFLLTIREDFLSHNLSKVKGQVSMFSDEMLPLTNKMKYNDYYESYDTSLDSPTDDRRERKLTFSLDKNEVFPIEHLNDMTIREVNSRWLCPSEFEAMESQTQFILRMMEMGYEMEGYRGHSTRGLELLTPEGDDSADRIELSINAVIMEQFQQLVLGAVDDEAMAEVYRRHTSDSMEDALCRAQRDAESVQSDLYEFRVHYVKKTGAARTPGHAKDMNQPAALAA